MAKILVGLFATPIVILVSLTTIYNLRLMDGVSATIVVLCLVGLLWVGITAWVRAGKPKGGR